MGSGGREAGRPPPEVAGVLHIYLSRTGCKLLWPVTKPEWGQIWLSCCCCAFPLGMQVGSGLHRLCSVVGGIVLWAVLSVGRSCASTGQACWLLLRTCALFVHLLVHSPVQSVMMAHSAAADGNESRAACRRRLLCLCLLLAAKMA